MGGRHERAEVGETRGEVRQGVDAEPGQQEAEEAGTDEGLEQQSYSGEPMFPTGVLDPGRMLTRLGRRSRSGCGSWLVRTDRRGHRQSGRLQTHQQRGAHDQVPPALDAPGIREPVIGPPEFVRGLLEAVCGSCVRSPNVLPTVRSIVPGRLVIRCQVVSGGVVSRQARGRDRW